MARGARSGKSPQVWEENPSLADPGQGREEFVAFHDAPTPTENDPTYFDLPEPLTEVANTTGGAPFDPLARQITKKCCLTEQKVLHDRVIFYRCVASSSCGWRLKNESRRLDRIYKHTTRCRALQIWKPDLWNAAVEEFSKGAPSSTTKRTRPRKGDAAPIIARNSTGTRPPSAPTQTAAQQKATDYFASFRSTGSLQQKDKIDLWTVRLFCAAGIPPRIADLREWDGLLQAHNPKLKYDPPSSTTLRDKLIPAEAANASIEITRFLRTQWFVTMSMDGLTAGHQVESVLGEWRGGRGPRQMFQSGERRAKSKPRRKPRTGCIAVEWTLTQG